MENAPSKVVSKQENRKEHKLWQVEHKPQKDSEEETDKT